jgi:hypothetical protein
MYAWEEYFMRARTLIDADVHAATPAPAPRIEDGTYERVRRTLNEALAELEAEGALEEAELD